MRLGNRPGSHEAAIAPPHHRQPIRIGDTGSDQAVHAGLVVLIIFAAPVADVGEAEGLSVSTRSTRVWPQHGIAAGGEGRDWVQPASPDKGFREHAGRTAVN